MKTLLSLLFVLVTVSVLGQASNAPVRRNYFTTNSAPTVIGTNGIVVTTNSNGEPIIDGQNAGLWATGIIGGITQLFPIAGTAFTWVTNLSAAFLSPRNVTLSNTVVIVGPDGILTNPPPGSVGQLLAVTSSGVNWSNFDLTIQTNGVNVGQNIRVVNINSFTGSVSGSSVTLGSTASGSGGGVAAITNNVNLSVQAIKLPTTNYPGIDAGNQNWEVIFYKTNAEGSIANLNGSWQFVVPSTYITNSLSVWLQYMLDATNGPNASNVIFQASVAKATPGNTNNHPRSIAFSTAVSQTNTWNGDTNLLYLKSAQLVLTNTINLAPRDLALLQITRDAVDDTYGGHVSLVGVQLEMVCTNILATIPPP